MVLKLLAKTSEQNALRELKNEVIVARKIFDAYNQLSKKKKKFSTFSAFLKEIEINQHPQA